MPACTYEHLLVLIYLLSMPEVQAKRECGVEVADIGCRLAMVRSTSTSDSIIWAALTVPKPLIYQVAFDPEKAREEEDEGNEAMNEA